MTGPAGGRLSLTPVPMAVGGGCSLARGARPRAVLCVCGIHAVWSVGECGVRETDLTSLPRQDTRAAGQPPGVSLCCHWLKGDVCENG